MTPRPVRRLQIAFLAALALALATSAPAQNRYGPGVSDTGIKVGNLVPYTGPFAEYGVIGRAEAAYFRMVNERGGINGRKVAFLSLDSGPKFQAALDQARALVERERVLLLFSTWGASVNRAIRPYLNERQVPQLFIASVGGDLEDPARFPWTMGFAPSRRTEAAAYAKYLLEHRPGARIAVLTSDDEDGAEYRGGLREGLGAKAEQMIVRESAFSYQDIDGIDALVAGFRQAGADVFMNLAVGRYATRGIRAAYDQGWRPLQFLPNAFLEPAGLEKAAGLICNARSKDWTTPEGRKDPAVQAFLAWMERYNPEGRLRDAQNVYGYEAAQALEEVLRRCGDELTRENVMRQATHLDLALGMLRPGIRLRTSPTDYRPIKDLFLVRFNGKEWVPLD